MAAFPPDLRHALRLLTRTPAFTLPAIVSLSLGIAANTTIFSVVSALMLRPLAAGGGGQLIRIGESIRNDGSFRAMSHPEYVYVRDHASTLDGILGHQPQSMTLSGLDGPQIVWGEIVTGNYFSVLRLTPPLGRAFVPEEDRVPGERAVIVISDGLWRRRFAADPAVAGQTVTLNSHRFTVVGVAPPGFHGTFPGFDIDLWVPVMMANVALPGADRLERQGDRFLMLLGRLKQGVTMAAARADLQSLAAQLAQADPTTNRDRGIEVAAATGVHPFIAGLVKAFLSLLMAIVGLVLLIACANVANLLLARAGARRREFAVRLALGAGRWVVVRQLLVESGVLALAGGGIGLLLSFWSIRALNAFHPPTGVPIALDLRVDVRVLLFTLSVSALTALVFGLAPALQATRVDLVPALKDEASRAGGRGSRLRGALVVVQVALSLVLLVGAALMVRSLRNSRALDPGFDPDHVVVVSFDPQLVGRARPRADVFYDELLARARALPGTEAAAFADFVLLGDRGDEMPFTIPGRTPPREEGWTAGYNRVSPGYFATVRMPLLRGRDFTDRDREGAPLVAIVNAAMAQRFWPSEDAIGKRIAFRGDSTERQIVGIVRDARYRSLGETTRPFLYFPAMQRYRPLLTLHARTSLPPAEATAAIKRIAHEIDPDVPAFDARPMRDAMAFSFVPVHIARTVFGVAGIIALLLAATGLYAVVSFTLSQRAREIGIRVALGAGRRHVFAVIVGGSIRLAVVGIVVGAAAAAAGSRLLTAFLYGLSPTDPATFVTIALLLLAVAFAASYGAARRGLNVDPVVALRHE